MTLALCLLIVAWTQLALLYCCFCLDTTRLHKAFRLPALPRPLPPTAVMIPVTGRNNDTEAALRSLLEQDYPNLTVYLAVCGTADPAYASALELTARYAHARLVHAPEAVRSGQKNQNLLSCLEAVDPDTAVYVFCDANHRAEPDFVRKLVHPILLDQADFCTGYRRSRLYTTEPATTAFHAINRFMLFLQSLPFFTQPWGGATAARAAAFKRLDVAGLWGRTVVDDSSLAGLLGKKGIPVLFCPDALLESSARSMTREALDEWLFRQLFYPRVYTFGAWLLIGFCLSWFAAACAACPYILLCTVQGGNVPFPMQAAALLVLCGQILLQELLRRRIAADCPGSAWIKGLAIAITALFGNYARTVTCRSIVWCGIRYGLGTDGRVLGVKRKGNEK
ncbi:MAG: glycosyltransferase family 2 protein [Desulfovibrio sp.]|nr:glycosyltransferase family 2 protein [Desulfovibrio sp.]